MHTGGQRAPTQAVDARDPTTTAPLTEVIRPAAIVPEEAARAILVELSLNSVHAGGLWLAEPSRWNRYDRPWRRADPTPATAPPQLLGTIQIAYGTPTKYEITIYRVIDHPVGAAARLDGPDTVRRGTRLRRPHPGRMPARDHGLPARPFRF